MADKNSCNKAYDEGYNRGKEGGMLDDFVHNVKDIVPGPNGKEGDSYDAGYNDGANDRGNDDNPNYNGGTSEDKGNCFVTTACILSKGLPDNCKELNTLRLFRDKYVLNLHNGHELNLEYKIIGPKLVTAINNNSDSQNIYDHIYNEIVELVDLIDKNENENAFNRYCSLLDNLTGKFGISRYN